MSKSIRDVVTPEGVVLKIEIADPWERAAAVVLDLLFIVLLIVGGALLLYFSGFLEFATNVAIGIFLIVLFFARSFYFIFFELRWRGRTPGKRLLGLRVMNRNGGPLLSDSIFARNFLREFELFIPISTLLFVDFEDLGQFGGILLLVWLAVFVLLPFFNKERMRAGDMVGGTWVVRTPKSTLLKDIAASASRPVWRMGENNQHTASITFSDAQLDIYGIYELQTLEKVLRVQGQGTVATQNEVCLRIQNKIDWPAAKRDIPNKVFLEAFYAALRARLEARMLLGKRRESKHDID